MLMQRVQREAWKDQRPPGAPVKQSQTEDNWVSLSTTRMYQVENLSCQKAWWLTNVVYFVHVTTWRNKCYNSDTKIYGLLPSLYVLFFFSLSHNFMVEFTHKFLHIAYLLDLHWVNAFLDFLNADMNITIWAAFQKPRLQPRQAAFFWLLWCYRWLRSEWCQELVYSSRPLVTHNSLHMYNTKLQCQGLLKNVIKEKNKSTRHIATNSFSLSQASPHNRKRCDFSGDITTQLHYTVSYLWPIG